MYLICDNGYLRWPTSIFPYTHVDLASTEGYFSSNLESVRKDVKCTFGILKKQWRILHYGLHYRDIKKCEKIFVTCCCLHKFLVDIMEWKVKRVQRGGPIDQHDGLWLEGIPHLILSSEGGRWSLSSILGETYLHSTSIYLVNVGLWSKILIIMNTLKIIHT